MAQGIQQNAQGGDSEYCCDNGIVRYTCTECGGQPRLYASLFPLRLTSSFSSIVDISLESLRAHIVISKDGCPTFVLDILLTPRQETQLPLATSRMDLVLAIRAIVEAVLDNSTDLKTMDLLQETDQVLRPNAFAVLFLGLVQFS